MAHLYSYFQFGNNNNNNNNKNNNNVLPNNNDLHCYNQSNNNSHNEKLGFEDQKWNQNSSNGFGSEDQQWNMVATKLVIHDQMRAKFDPSRNLAPSPKGYGNAAQNVKLNSSPKQPSNKAVGGKHKSSHKTSSTAVSVQNDVVNSMISKILSLDIKQPGVGYDPSTQKGLLAQPNQIQSPGLNSPATDKRFKTLPPSESLPRNETLGGYIFVCNNDTMQEDLKRQLFGLPQRFRDSVRAIQPGLPLFLYNYTTHQLHGIFEAASFGGSNIDPSAWEDKKNKGESRFPAQVRIRVRKVCKPLEEDAFRPVLHHYDGPKFRLQLSVPETLAILDLLSENGAP